MKNEKVIVLAGWAHGGTNIVWNLLQSHPEICSSGVETGELLRRSPALLAGLIASGACGLGAVRRFVDRRLFEAKMSNLASPENRFVTEGVAYTSEQVARAGLCLKSVNYDIFLTRFLARVYPQLYVVALLRDGYALCEGYTRRGKSAARAGRLYARIARQMRHLAESTPRFKMVRFEDVLADPFAVAEDCFRFLQVEPLQLEALRLKAKRVVGREGLHETTYGVEDRKYWFNRETIGEILRPQVEEAQRGRLGPRELRAFERRAGPALEELGYRK